LYRLPIDGRLPGRPNARARTCLLSISERFDRGWIATPDGARLDTVALRGDFLPCEVPAGAHRVEPWFMPRSFVVGLVMSVAGVVLLVLVAVIVGRSG
jgi:uncharacterized membrane protein YfhO